MDKKIIAILFIYLFMSLLMSCDFQQCGSLTCVGSDEPVRPPFKL